MKKKIALAILGLTSVVVLGACSKNQDLATMKGGKIKMEDFFQDVKHSQEVQQKFTTKVIYKVAELGYGDKVSKDDVQKTYDRVSEPYGDAFIDQLKGAGLTEATYKEQIKTQLSYVEMLKAHADLKDEDLAKIWETYHPEVEIGYFMTTDEKAAEEVAKSAAKADDMKKLAEDNSNDKVRVSYDTIKFDSTMASLPNEVKEAAYALKDDEISKVVKVSQKNQTGQETTTYFVIKMIKAQDKGDDMSKFKDKLEEIAINEKQQDQAFTQKVISAELKKANVKILDNDLKTGLAAFLEDETKESSDKKSDNSSDKKEETKESSTESSK